MATKRQKSELHKAAATIEGIDVPDPCGLDLSAADRASAVATLTALIEDKTVLPRDKIHAVEVKSKLLGLLVNTPTEWPERAAELSAVEQREAQLIALWRFSPAAAAAADATLAGARPLHPPSAGGLIVSLVTP